MNTRSYNTVSAKKEEVKRNWYLVDATNQTAGRLFSRIAAVLRGKHKPDFTPHVDTGDNIVVINADKIRFTGKKLDQKEFLRYTGYPGGLKRETARNLLSRKPESVIEIGVRGMLPHTKLGNAMIKKLFVYAGGEHPHQAQKPQPFNF
ncbi:MAG: 50S ribosomal protein L13 [Saprospiraceae bacterium]|nr:50S ribosomal protein L13 [Saprospiraceae bacterium]